MSVPVMTVPGEPPASLTTAAVRASRAAQDLRQRRDRRRTPSPASTSRSPAGEFTAIMGPSGSGKSTLMHCLAGLDTATAGQVWLGDTELTSLRDDQLTTLRRQRIGFVFQSFNLLPVLDARENIVLPMQLAGQRPDRGLVRRRHRPARPARAARPPPARALRRPAAARRHRPRPAPPPGRRLRRRAHRQPGLPLRRRGARPAALQRQGDRPDRRHGHPRPDRPPPTPTASCCSPTAGSPASSPTRPPSPCSTRCAGWGPDPVRTVLLAQLRAHAARLIASTLAVVIAVGFVVATLVLNETSRSTVLDAVGARYVDTAAVVTSDDGASLADDVADARPPLGSRRRRRPVLETGVQASVPGPHRLPVPAGRVRRRRPRRCAGSSSPPARLPDRRRRGRRQRPRPRRGRRRPHRHRPTTPRASETTSEATVTGIVDLRGDPEAGLYGRGFVTERAGPGVGRRRPDRAADRRRPRLRPPSRLRHRRRRGPRRPATSRCAPATAAGREGRRRSSWATRPRWPPCCWCSAPSPSLVAGLVIANTFAVLLAQRTRELALLRCVGATARQVRRSVLGEALATGLVASAIGVARRHRPGRRRLGASSAPATPPIPLSGVSVPLVRRRRRAGRRARVVTVLAALAPARAATRVAPLAALRPVDPAPLRSRARRRCGWSLGLLLLLPGVGAARAGRG